MTRKQTVVELEALRRIEHLYRQRLDVDPSDMVARVSLAWALFMLALHQAGRESVLRALVETEAEQDEQLANRLRSILDQDAGELLKDSLRQAVAVQQLSADPVERADVLKLQRLVVLSGGSEAISEADATAAKILAEVTREIFKPRAPRRRIRRRSGRPHADRPADPPDSDPSG